MLYANLQLIYTVYTFSFYKHNNIWAPKTTKVYLIYPKLSEDKSEFLQYLRIICINTTFLFLS